MILPNTFRERLSAGHPTLGTHFMLTDPDIPELIGDIGLFDYGEFSAEYAPSICPCCTTLPVRRNQAACR